MDKTKYWNNKLNIIKNKNPNLILDRALEYHTIREKIELGCSKHENIYWFQITVNHISDSKLTCPLCSGKDKTSINQELENNYPNFDFSEFKYINALTLSIVICKKCGNKWNTTYNNIKAGNGCPMCSNKQHLNSEQWRKLAEQLKGDKYDYSLANYINNSTPVEIICKKCGEHFLQNPYNHLYRNCNCKCYYRLTTKTFIDKAKLIHGDKYDYNLVNYINNKTKIKIICKKHGIFEQLPSSHLQGHGCPLCAIKPKKEKISKRHKLTTKEFIERSKKCHTIKYDYSLVNYINKETKVKIICPIHGVFEQRAGTHLLGCNCPKCAKSISGKKSNIKYKLTSEEFIKRAREVHGNKYDYNLVDYKNKKTKVKIICPIHGVFEQRPDSHLSGNGCPVCKESKGERTIRIFLERNKINYISQKKFNDLIDRLPLSYDFYLPEFNLLIEYNGEQHYKKCFNKSYKDFLIQKHHDWLKRKYARDNNIKLLVIPYWENTEDCLKKLI